MKNIYVLGAVLLCAVAANNAQAKITTHTTTDAIRLVTDKTTLDALVEKDKRFTGLELVALEVEDKGALGKRTFTFQLKFTMPIGDGDKSIGTACNVTVTTQEKIVKAGPPVPGGPSISVNQLTFPKFSDIFCAM